MGAPAAVHDGEALSSAPQPTLPRSTIIAWTAATCALVLLKISPLTFVDPDVWHQLAFARAFLETGALPGGGTFAYTPTVDPLVHHEWGAGLLWLLVLRSGGGAAFLTLKYALVAAALGLTAWTAKRRGASSVAILLFAPPAVLLVHYGCTTIRAQLLTLVAVAALLRILPLEGRERWKPLLLWLAVQWLWINVHAGAVVGIGFLGLACLERAVRREIPRLLAGTFVAALLLLLATPWGLDYPSYLARAITMERPDITEWQPLWVDLERRWLDLLLWTGLGGASVYAVWQSGWRACRGASLVAVSAAFALLHQRHVTLFAITWFALVPPWLTGTPLLVRVTGWVQRRKSVVTIVAGAAAALWFVGAGLQEPWRLRVPTDAASRDLGQPTYPVGAMDYLVEQRFEGSLMTPFGEGAYAMWRLAPRGARVSYDSRYEAAYRPEVGAHHAAFYRAGASWAEALTLYPPDAVLVPRVAPVMTPMQLRPDWRVVYGDDLFVLFAPVESPLPFADRRGRGFTHRFP